MEETPAGQTAVREEKTERSKARDWPACKKWTTTLILSGFAFLQPLAETMLAPISGDLGGLGIAYAYEWVLVNSLILVGVGLSPLLLAPLSEAYGRRPVIMAATAWFVAWNTACGESKTLGQLLAFRLLSGFGASAADTIAPGVLSDLWRPEERGRALAGYMAAPLLGPALGPICGGYISQAADWRWVFRATSIASAAVLVVAAFFLHETHQAPDREDDVSTAKLLRENLQRPFRMLATQVIIQLLAGYMALLYGTMFLFLFMYPRLWSSSPYNEDAASGSLNYLSFAVGLVAGVALAGPLSDTIYARLKKRGPGRPELRVPPMAIGTFLVPAGLLWWGWAGERGAHSVVPNLGSATFAMGVYVCSACVSVYTIDAYGKYASSAVSTNLVIRSLTAAVFPLFAPYMFDALGFGLGATALAAGFAVLGTVVAVILWRWGEKLRARSPYCAEGA